MKSRLVIPFALALVALACGGSVQTGEGRASSSSGGSSGSSGASGSSGTSSGDNPPPVFTLDACKGAAAYKPLRDVTFGAPLDGDTYIELRDEVNPEDIQGGTGGGAAQTYTRAVDQRGSLCKGATDAAACESAFEALRSHRGWTRQHPAGIYIPNSHMYLAYTRGDEMGVIDTDAALLPLLAPVTSMENAALIVTLMNNHDLFCSGPQVATNGSEFLFDARSGGSCSDLYAYLDHVTTPTGAFRSEGKKLLQAGNLCP